MFVIGMYRRFITIDPIFKKCIFLEYQLKSAIWS
jgi:hypothetical protein